RITLKSTSGWLGEHRWVGGLMWQRVELRDYQLQYAILEGRDGGTRGTIDFDSNYSHLSPLLGLALPRVWTHWAVAPHALLAWPFPRRGFVGHITGPGFDLHGDQADHGAGKHFGDPSFTLGLDVSYLPANLTLDVGTLVTQRLAEPLVHRGIESNW